MKTPSLCILTVALLCAGCASQPGTGQRVAIDSLATGIGGAAAYFGGGKNPALTTAGAVGGFVVAEGLQAMARSGRQKAYNSGIEEGKAIGQEQILRGLWGESNGLPRSAPRRYQPLTPTMVLPARTQNGARYDPACVTPQQASQTKIRVPTQSAPEAGYPAHYENPHPSPHDEPNAF